MILDFILDNMLT